MNRPLARIAALAAAGALSAHGASLLTLTNPVADGAINTIAGNNDRSDWVSTTPFTADPDEANTIDYSSITVAHDSTSFHFRQQLFRNDAGGYLSNSQKLILDTDQARATGYLGPDGNFAVGGEYMLEGATLYVYTGTGIDWSWAELGRVTSYEDWPVLDHEMSLSRAAIGGPVSFDFIAITDFWGGDNYPDGAKGGSTGDCFTYTTVPEPAAAALAALALLTAGRRRRR